MIEYILNFKIIKFEVFMQYNSIQEFQINFTKIFHSQVMPVLFPFEKERLRTKNFVFVVNSVLSGIAVIVAILFFIHGFLTGSFDNDLTKFCLFIIIGLIVVCFSVYSWKKKDFENKLKEKVMPLLMPAFGNFRWTTCALVSMTDLEESQVISYFEKMSVDDNFVGSYKGVPIKISELHLTYETRDSKGRRHEHTAFKGVVIVLEIPKIFKGHTIVKEKVLINSGPYDEVKLEDPEFSKKFHVRSNDQIEARVLLTPSFMERYKNIQRAFNANTISCSFLGKRLLLAVPVNKDLFSLGDLNKPVTDTKQFDVFLNEIVTIFELIEELKLYENTGL